MSISFHMDLDDSLITSEEVRPVLNANFLICRLLSKVVAPSHNNNNNNNNSDKAYYLVQALKRYQYLSHYAPRLCEKRGLTVSEIFSEEYNICNEMTSLLPGKIDRICYMGESGLSL
jgi:hypothetical protein